MEWKKWINSWGFFSLSEAYHCSLLNLGMWIWPFVFCPYSNVNSSPPLVWLTVSCGSKPSLPAVLHCLLLGVFSHMLSCAVLHRLLVMRQKDGADLEAGSNTPTGLWGWRGRWWGGVVERVTLKVAASLLLWKWTTESWSWLLKGAEPALTTPAPSAPLGEEEEQTTGCGDSTQLLCGSSSACAAVLPWQNSLLIGVTHLLKELLCNYCHLK